MGVYPPGAWGWVGCGLPVSGGGLFWFGGFGWWFGFGVASVVACLAAGAEVLGVVGGSAFADGDDVVYGGGFDGAAGGADLAGVVVAVEDLFSDALPGSVVGWFSHEVAGGGVATKGRTPDHPPVLMGVSK